MKTLIAFTLLLFSFKTPQTVTGRWETIEAGGNTPGMMFKPDNHFEDYINKKPFASSTYIFSNNTIRTNGNECNEMPGKYKIHFSANTNSIFGRLVARQEKRDWIM